MPIGGVSRDEVDDDVDLATMRLGEEPVEIGEIPEGRVDVAVVRNVVAEVGHRRAVERREPDPVDAERSWRAVVQVIEARGDAGEVADPVAIRVLERAGIDLVEDALAPPRTAHAPIVPISLVP